MAAATLGRRQLGLLLATESVRVNGRRARKGTIVQAGDQVTVDPPSSSQTDTSVAATCPLPLVYEDATLVVIDKPPGIPSTIGRSAGPSVAATLLLRYPEMAAIDGRRAAGLVHRLDTGTSGLLLAARDLDSHTRLRDAFVRKAVAKDYLAVVVGRLDRAETVSVALARHPRSPGRMIPARGTTKAWPAHTEITPVESDDGLSVVRLRMRTGVTHQLRLHLALLGHPVVGDTRYGRPHPDVPSEGWHYLHARGVHFDAPELPRGLATPFPEHWRRLFAARGWSEI